MSHRTYNKNIIVTVCHFVAFSGKELIKLMPSQTFFRLPDNKRERLLNASREEFMQVKFSDASINKIIANAEISRGSFYQYFTDKSDLFEYLLDEVKVRLQSLFNVCLENSNGDIFDASCLFFDLFFENCNEEDDFLTKYLKILKANPDMGFLDFMRPWFVFHSPDDGQLCINDIKDSSDKYMHTVLGMIVMTISTSIICTIFEPEKIETYRVGLKASIEILKYGCLNANQTEQLGGKNEE